MMTIGEIRRRLLRGSVAASALIAFAQSVPVHAQEQTFSFDIPAQDLASALRAFARTSRQQVTFDDRAVRGKRAPALKGTMGAGAALERLLGGSGLIVQRGRSGLFIIRQAPPASAAIVAGVETASSSGEDDGRGIADEEIVVTAQKREERLQDVPVPVTALAANQLLSGNQVRLQEYYSRIPGLDLTANLQSKSVLSIRGINPGGNLSADPTVGVVIDDVPYGASLGVLGGGQVPDLDPGELQRVEVLKGPQGTLYGASSLSGLLKFVTIDPSTRSLSGRVRVGINTVHGAGDEGYDGRAGLNVPINAEIALRASGFVRREPGYVDNVQTGERDVNELNARGARFAVLWRPSKDLSIKLSALFQQTKGDGDPRVDVSLGGLRQSRSANTGWFNRRQQVYSAIVDETAGNVELTAISGYSINKVIGSFDFSFFNIFTGPIFGGVTGVSNISDYRTEKFSQELRARVLLGENVEWLVGGFYTTENSVYPQTIIAIDNISGETAGTALANTLRADYREYAIFTNVTAHLSDRLNIQLGGRQTEVRASGGVKSEGPLLPLLFGVPSPFVAPTVSANNSAFTFLVTPEFKISDDAMVYARIASGFRPGAANFPLAVAIPVRYRPDHTVNYELGFKGGLFNRRLNLDGSLYWIDWSDIQIGATALGVATYVDNGGKARSRGFELSLDARPIDSLSIGGWVSVNDAKLTSDLPPVSTIPARKGDRLPLSSRFSANAFVEKRFVIGADAELSFGVTYSHVGNRLADFMVLAPGLARPVLPAYDKLDLRATVTKGDWSADLYFNNVTDERGVLSASPNYANLGEPTIEYVQPRTIGIALQRKF